ncbi:MAG TPA: DsbA family protein [Polyangiaceae bacterium]
MRFSWYALLRAAALVALLGSSALTIDYLSPIPSFCGVQSGCGTVRQSDWGYLGDAGIPLPALGLAAFTALFTLSLLPGGRRRLAGPAAILAGVLGAGLLAVQAFVIRAFCSLCLAVDGAAIVAGVIGVFILRATKDDPRRGAPGVSSVPPNAVPEPLHDWAWGGLAALAVIGPLVWPTLRPAPDVPREIAAHFVRGKINVVEFVDFQCPFCRLLHPEIKKLVAEYGARVNFVRLDLPLDMHPQARGAARAHLCAVAHQRGDAMADVLFEAEDLTEPGLVAAARKVGLDPGEFQRCLAAPETEKRLQKTERILRDTGLLQGLPTTFVGAQMLVGAQEEVTLRDAFEKAADGSEGGVPGPLYFAVFAIGAALVVWFGRSSRAPARPQS